MQMVRKRVRTPQEKKRLSLERDRRNTFGQNDKGSRKAIPRNKKQANRAIRRADKVDITQDPDAATENLKVSHRTKWKKVADAALGETVGRQNEKQVDRFGGKIRRRQERLNDTPDTSKDET